MHVIVHFFKVTHKTTKLESCSLYIASKNSRIQKPGLSGYACGEMPEPLSILPLIRISGHGRPEKGIAATDGGSIPGSSGYNNFGAECLEVAAFRSGIAGKPRLLYAASEPPLLFLLSINRIRTATFVSFINRIQAPTFAYRQPQTTLIQDASSIHLLKHLYRRI